MGLFPDSEKAAVEDSAFYEKVDTGYDLIYRPGGDEIYAFGEKKMAKRRITGLKMLLYRSGAV